MSNSAGQFDDERLLSDIYRELGISWEKTLRKLELPTDIGIVRRMTLGEAKALAARKSGVPASRTETVVSRVVDTVRHVVHVFSRKAISADLLDTIHGAIEQEVAASKSSVRSFSLEIDAIKHLQSSGGNFVYQLLMSEPVNFSPEQTLSFKTRATKETINATVIKCDDEGLVVATQQPLPSDARLIQVTFDPSFIYRAIGDYLEAASTTRISELFLAGEIPPIPQVRSWAYGEFNEDQAAAISEMGATPIHLLWGPPGTGKTTTLGEAVANWLRKRKRVLVVATSNAAVDVAMKAILKRIQPKERQQVLRLGASLDAAVNEITLSGKLKGIDWESGAEAHAALTRLNELANQLSHRTNSTERFQELFAEYTDLEGIVGQFNERANALEPKLLSEVLVTGCTLARMVLDQAIREKKFDIVVVDEVSMTSVIYALAASTLATDHLVLAGDPKQLRPICQSDEFEAREWFSKNVYDWFDVVNEEDGQIDQSRCSVLRTQYRMTDEIGGVVSRLSYGNILRHGRQERGSHVEFVEIPPEWETTHFSVTEKSYFHLGTIPIIHQLSRFLIKHKELLLLSPFRPQRSLLSAMASDLAEGFPQTKAYASTIHRSQGSESRAVVLDLTTHDPQNLVTFFRDRHCANLVNVGISRAQDRLVILGSLRMLKSVVACGGLWPELLTELEKNTSILPADELLGHPLHPKDLVKKIDEESPEELPALYASDSFGLSDELLDLLERLKSGRKLLVVPKRRTTSTSSGIVVRHEDGAPRVFVANGHICLPFQGGWATVRSPSCSRVIWRVAFSHLADEEVNPLLAKRFFCPDCANGDLVLKRYGGEGWYLVCSNQQMRECTHRKRLSLEDARLKVRIAGMTCPDNHPLTARTGARGIFLGCENYPACEHTGSLSLIEGM